ncbi:MAG TPA: IniB N-terminal domain-containing protein, partial [Arthrobacter sp.]|nr:IniB N-terminal domain-containing protein [Arthrobacter sp.]
MPTLANTLLEFILNLLRDPDAAHAFREDPERELEHAGLSDVCSDDVDAIMPVVLDFAPVGVGASFDREYNTGDNSSRIDHNNPDNDGGNNNDGGGGGGRDNDNDNY